MKVTLSMTTFEKLLRKFGIFVRVNSCKPGLRDNLQFDNEEIKITILDFSICISNILRIFIYRIAFIIGRI